MKAIGLDVGFGWTKVCVMEENTDPSYLKFPSWIAYHSNTPISELEIVVADGKEYVVGYDAKHEQKRIILSDINDLINYYPVIEKYVLTKLKITGDYSIVTGLPPLYKDLANKLTRYNVKVIPQGLGIWLDVKDDIKADESMIVDIGFNTVDYLIVADNIKKKGATITKLGVERLVELFRDTLPQELEYLRQSSFQKLMLVFEKGYAIFEGEKILLEKYKEKAIEHYNEIVMSRLKNELGGAIEEIEMIVIAGGGAYYMKNLRKAGVYIPQNPELSQARGYAKLCLSSIHS